MGSFLQSLSSGLSSGLGSGLAGMAIGTGSSLLSNLFNSNSATKQSKELMDYQSQLSQKQWQEQFNAQNDRQDFLNLSSASTQKQALKNAGLSVASGVSGQPFSSAVSSPSGISPSGGMSNYASFNGMDALRLANETKLNNANIGLINAQKNKVNQETETETHRTAIEAINAQWLGREKIQNFEFQRCSIQLNESAIDKNLTEIDSLKQSLANMIEQGNYIMKQSELIQKDIDFYELRYQLDKDLNEARIRDIFSGIQLNNANISQIREATESIIVGRGLTKEQTSNLKKIGVNLSIEGQQMRFNLESDKQWKNTERMLQCIESGTRSAKNVTSAVKDVSDTARSWIMPWSK